MYTHRGDGGFLLDVKLVYPVWLSLGNPAKSHVGLFF